MKRMHIHLGVEDLNQSIRFYSALFGTQPAKVHEDYAKWMLDDPRLNFAISTRASKGLDHLGLQVDKADEMTDLRERLKSADMAVEDQGETVCCYARSDKSWLEDPAGIAWEAYQTMEDVQLFSGIETDTASAGENACCMPSSTKSSGCC